LRIRCVIDRFTNVKKARKKKGDSQKKRIKRGCIFTYIFINGTYVPHNEIKKHEKGVISSI